MLHAQMTQLASTGLAQAGPEIELAGSAPWVVLGVIVALRAMFCLAHRPGEPECGFLGTDDL